MRNLLLDLLFFYKRDVTNYLTQVISNVCNQNIERIISYTIVLLKMLTSCIFLYSQTKPTLTNKYN